MNTFTLPFQIVLLCSSIIGYHQIQEDKVLPQLTTIIYEDQSDFSPGQPLGPDCLFETDFRINVAHLAPVGSDTSGLFPLPQGAPPMFLAYSIGTLRDTIQLTLFDYSETLDGLQGPVNIYQATVPVSYEVSEECKRQDPDEAKNPIDLPWAVSLLTLNSRGGYLPYPVCSYTDSGQIFTCNAFHETVPFCKESTPTCDNAEHTYADGVYEIYCGECINAGLEKDNPTNVPPVKKRMAASLQSSDATLSVSVSPNPFDKYLLLNATATEKPEKITFRLYNVSGQLIHSEIRYSASHTSDWSLPTANLSKGVYFLQLEAKDANQTIKLFKY
ncbi:MAG: T9SS type A sorting domain-containing protein [Bacteroidota bacterium]